MTKTGPARELDRAVFGGSRSPIGWSVGWLEAPLADFERELVAWRRSLGHDILVSRDIRQWPLSLDSLSPLAPQWNRELLVAHGGWTAYLNNARDGGDMTSGALLMPADRLGARFVTATHQPQTAVGHAATQFELRGPAGQPPSMLIRAVSAHATDGRWHWYSDGPVQDFEQPDRYHARLVKERFDRKLLIDYLGALGIRPDDDSGYGSAVLVERRMSWPRPEFTLDEARAWWGID